MTNGTTDALLHQFDLAVQKGDRKMMEELIKEDANDVAFDAYFEREVKNLSKKCEESERQLASNEDAQGALSRDLEEMEKERVTKESYVEKMDRELEKQEAEKEVALHDHLKAERTHFEEQHRLEIEESRQSAALTVQEEAKSKLEEMKTKQEEHEEELSLLADRIQELQAEMVEEQKELIEKKQGDTEAAKAELAEKENLLKELERRCKEEIEAQRVRILEEKAELERQMSELEKNVRELSRQSEQLEEEMHLKSSEINQTALEGNYLSDKLAAAQREESYLGRVLSETEEEIKQLEQREDDAEEQMLALERDMDLLELNMKKYRAAAADQKAKYCPDEAPARVLESLEADKVVLQYRMKCVTQQVGSIKREKAKCEQRKQTTEKKLENKRTEIKDLKFAQFQNKQAHSKKTDERSHISQKMNNINSALSKSQCELRSKQEVREKVGNTRKLEEAMEEHAVKIEKFNNDVQNQRAKLEKCRNSQLQESSVLLEKKRGIQDMQRKRTETRKELVVVKSKIRRTELDREVTGFNIHYGKKILNTQKHELQHMKTYVASKAAEDKSLLHQMRKGMQKVTNALQRK